MQTKAILALTFVLTALQCLIAVQPALSQQSTIQQYWINNYGSWAPVSTNYYAWQVVGKAQPDECFFGVGSPNNLASFEATYPGSLSTGYNPCSFNGSQGTPKVNQAYLWGLTAYKTDLWFGTIANTLCLVMEELGETQPLQENELVCEGVGKDVRPPRIFNYNTLTSTLTDMTPLVLSAGPPHSSRLLNTIGLRSAGSLGNVVILAGISPTGVAMFAFNGQTKQFIDSIVFDGSTAALPKYNNIRKWIVVNNQLYVGVATGTPSGFGSTSGSILHWIGNTAAPFQFETVGTVPGDPAYLTYFNNSIFVSTWGGPAGSDGTVLCMSPQFTSKLAPSTAQWPTVWQLSNYEVEPSAAAGGGAIAGFDGWLYFTTMTPPGAQLEQFQALYPSAPTDSASLGLDFLGSYRPTEMFRGRNFGTPNQQIQLLYGNTVLPKYDPIANHWSLVLNNLNQSPMWGFAGYNDFFNSYTWWMQTYNNELFIGTFNWDDLLFEEFFYQYGQNIPPQIINAARSYEGADLLRLHSSSSTPVFLSLNGMGNFSNYGIRTMIPVNNYLFLGTANPFNLLTTPGGEYGGWELLQLWPTTWGGKQQ
jgi:hypothetical protein